MPNEVVGIDIVARLDAFRAELAKIPDIGGKEAKSLASQLSREIKGAEKAARDAATAAKATTTSMAASGKAAEQAIGRSKEAIAQLGSAITVISPEVGGIVTQIGALSGAGKAGATALSALGLSGGAAIAILGPLALVAGAVAVAWLDWSREVKLSNALLDTQRRADESLVPQLRAVEDASLALAAATGELTDEQVRQARASLAAQRAVQDLAKSQAAERKEIQSQIDSAQGWMEGLAELSDTATRLTPAGWIARWTDFDDLMLSAADSVGNFSGKLENANGLMQELDGTLVRSAAAQREIRDKTERAAVASDKQAAAQRELRDKTERAAVASDKHAAATRGQTAATRDLVAAEREAARLMDEADAAGEALRQSAAADQRAMLTGEDAILARHEVERAQLEALAEKSYDYGAIESARLAQAARQERELADYRAEVADEQARRLAEVADEQARRLAAAIEQAQALHDSQRDAILGTTYSALSSLAGVADASIGALGGTGPAAEAAFRAWKALSYAAAVTQGYQAAVSAYAAMVGIPVVGPILAPIAAGAAAAATGVQIAQIAATEMPAHHSGRLADDEILSVLTRNESVITRQGTQALGGADVVKAANSGQPVAAPVQRIRVEYGHRAFDAFAADHLRSPNTALAKAIASAAGRRPGYRY